MNGFAELTIDNWQLTIMFRNPVFLKILSSFLTTMIMFYPEGIP